MGEYVFVMQIYEKFIEDTNLSLFLSTSRIWHIYKGVITTTTECSSSIYLIFFLLPSKQTKKDKFHSMLII